MGGVTAFSGQPVAGGSARGEAVAADVPLSFWGGFDPETGIIIDRRHPLAGQSATGGSPGDSVRAGIMLGKRRLLEAIHNGTAPAGIVTSRLDPVIALGCILGDELYACHPPLLVISDRERLLIETGDAIEIDDSGFITITKA